MTLLQRNTQQTADVEKVKGKAEAVKEGGEKGPKDNSSKSRASIKLPSKWTSPSQATPRASPEKQKRPQYDTEKVLHTHALLV